MQKNNLVHIDTRVDQSSDSTQADMLLGVLEMLGSNTVFGVPGGAIEPLFNALARARDNESMSIRTIVARHEAAAAYMAEGFARVTGRLGVCCATTGPGATNLITGVSSAMTENQPVLVITAQTALPNTGRRGLQESSMDEIDTVAMFKSCTRYSSLVSHPSQLEHKLFKALKIALGKSPGPVHLSIPVDILNHGWAGEYSINFANLLLSQKTIDIDAIRRLQRIVADSRKFVLYIGTGCRSAIENIIEFADISQCRFVTSPAARGLVDSYHPLYCGVFGFAGHDSAIECLADAEVDTVFAIGTRLNELATSGWDASALMNRRLVHIDENEENFLYSGAARDQIGGDLNELFRELLGFARRHDALKRRQDLAYVPHRGKRHGRTVDDYIPQQLKLTFASTVNETASPLKPQYVVRELVHCMPDNCRFVADAGNTWSWATHYLFPRHTQDYHIGMGFGAMAWGIGVAVGMAAADSDTTVVCITGDGSYLMSSHELSVAVQEQLPVVFVVLNDSAMGMVKHGQMLGRGEAIGFELPRIDFASMARAMGAHAMTVKVCDDFEHIQIPESGPLLIDVLIDPEQLPPMGARMKVLDRRQSDRRQKSDRRYSMNGDYHES